MYFCSQGKAPFFLRGGIVQIYWGTVWKFPCSLQFTLVTETSPTIWDVTSLDKVTWDDGCNSSMNRTACRFPIFSSDWKSIQCVRKYAVVRYSQHCGCSSVDRVLATEAKGRGFDPRQPHQSKFWRTSPWCLLGSIIVPLWHGYASSFHHRNQLEHLGKKYEFD